METKLEQFRDEMGPKIKLICMSHLSDISPLRGFPNSGEEIDHKLNFVKWILSKEPDLSMPVNADAMYQEFRRYLGEDKPEGDVEQYGPDDAPEPGMIRGILIDPVKKLLKEVRVRKNDINDIYQTLSVSLRASNKITGDVDVFHYPCNVFCCPISFANNDALYSNDEGWLKERPEYQAGFTIGSGWAYPLLGRSLILGTDDEGGSNDAKSDIFELKNEITWFDHKQMRLYNPEG